MDESKRPGTAAIVLGSLGVVFMVVLALLQPSAPPDPPPVGLGAAQQAAVLLVPPLVVLVPLVVLFVRARRAGAVDTAGRRVLGPRKDSMESAVHQRAASTAFIWMLAVMSMNVAVSELLARQPLQLHWWPLIGLAVFGLALLLHRRQLT
ncbi:hypothetical protein [Saccharopolyspora sp. 5N708]|uniref:hypothetical protein n=1 Tax=Saccharopolyspora sp. 5N708 TaxID=3457424 RepID=UPI003FD0F4F8